MPGSCRIFMHEKVEIPIMSITEHKTESAVASTYEDMTLFCLIFLTAIGFSLVFLCGIPIEKVIRSLGSTVRSFHQNQLSILLIHFNLNGVCG